MKIDSIDVHAIIAPETLNENGNSRTLWSRFFWEQLIEAIPQLTSLFYGRSFFFWYLVSGAH